MELLAGAVRSYPWGSRTVIAELLGRGPAAPRPEAELWLGAHPLAPSRIIAPDGTEQSLLAVLNSAPERQLGPECRARWGVRLPFLLKILAAERPLSVQAHPSAKQALEGYAREEAAGVPRDAPHRTYRDSYAKPELVCALSEFHALAGFRAPDNTVALLRSLSVPELDAYAALLAEQPASACLRTVVTTWLTLPDLAVRDLLRLVLDACATHADACDEHAGTLRTMLQLGEAFPGDRGVLTALLLNPIVLRPGEAIYLPPGIPHTYLSGTAVEIQASSDNTLRCGLTAKHVDVPELVQILDFAGTEPAVLRGEPVTPHLRVYRTDAGDFELSTVHWDAGQPAEVPLEGTGPQILICTSGAATLRQGRGPELGLRRGDSVWLSAADRRPVLRPDGAQPATLFRATVGS